MSLCRFCAVAGKAGPLEKRSVSVLRGAGNNAIASVIMRVTCPNCQTEYEVPDAALTRARTLRCAKCMTKFQVPALDLAPPEPAAAEPEAEPAPMADEVMPGDRAEVAQAQKHEWADILQNRQEIPAAAEPEPSAKRGLAISIVLVLALILALLVAHRTIGSLWPPSVRLFDALGLR